MKQIGDSVNVDQETLSRQVSHFIFQCILSAEICVTKSRLIRLCVGQSDEVCLWEVQGDAAEDGAEDERHDASHG